MPVWRGAEFLPATLRSIREQTYDGFKVRISIEPGDAASVEACRSVAGDPRFEVVVQPERLGWPGNFNWLVERCDLPFLVYWQQDDLASATYLEVLRAALLADPGAAVAHTDVQWFGSEIRRDALPSIAGPPLARILQQFEDMSYVPLRGLVRASMLPPAPVVPVSRDLSAQQEFVFLSRLAAAGGFTRVDGALYFKQAHGEAAHKRFLALPEHRRRREWARVGAGVLSGALAAAEPGHHGAVLAVVLDRLAVQRPGRAWFFEPGQTAGDTRDLALGLADEAAIDLGDERWEPGAASGLERPVHPRVTAVLRAERERAAVLRAGEVPLGARLGWGWHDAEPWGAWSRGEHASVELGAWPGGVLRLEGQVFAPLGPVRVGWSLDGDEPRFSALDSGDRLELAIDVPAGARRVHLHLPDAVAPAQASVSADPRVICVGLEHVVAAAP